MDGCVAVIADEDTFCDLSKYSSPRPTPKAMKVWVFLRRINVVKRKCNLVEAKVA